MNNITKSHRYTSMANQCLSWLDVDNEQRWHQHMRDPERQQQLIKYGYDKPGIITYSLNSHGFRSDEFDDSPGFIALGCSFTMGIGLPVDHVWPSMVSQDTGLKAWNLGIGGCGLDTCFRMLYSYIDVLHPRFVMLLMPDPDRFETHMLGQPEMIMHNSPPTTQAVETIKKHYFSDPQNTAVNVEKNMLAIRQMCDSRGIKLINKPVYPTLLGQKLTTDKWPDARDLMHVGHAHQRHCADQFLADLDQN